MPISFSRYVSIASTVAGATAAAVRQLIGRIFTNNPLLPYGSFVEFTSAADVGAYFGTSSAEYLRALFYFSWISNIGQSAKKISYAAWASVARAPQIFGNQSTKTLAALQAITAGTFTLTLGGASNVIGPVNLASANSFAAVASAIQAAINVVSGALWSSATVTYNATLSSFVFTGGVAGACTIDVQDGTQNLATVLGWLPEIPSNGQQLTSTQLSAYAIWAPGAAVEDIAAAIAASAQASNNFGSLLVMPTLTQDQMVEVGQWVSGQNVQYRYCVPVNVANAAALSAALIGYSGPDLGLAPLAGEYPEMVPMIQEAATDYTQRNAASNYMFKQFGLTPSVTDDADANTYDALRVNYYGNTQNAGQQINFWQRGVMMGGATAPVDENTFSNESWLKSAAGAAIMSLQLALQKIPANVSGENKIYNAVVGGVIGSPQIPATALYNGVISVGKPLTQAQIAAVTDETGSNTAWRQVQNQGWWFGVEIVPYTDPTNNLPGYKAQYTLVYSKDDVVRFVDGTDVLI